MNNINKVSQILLYFSILFGSLWLGTYFSKLLLYYQFFEPKDFILKPVFNDQNLHAALIELTPLIVVSIILYLLFIISYFLFISISKISLKKNGWLFVSTVIIFITMPFELYLTSIDYKIATTILSNNFDSMNIIRLIVDRFKVLSSFPIIELLCYFAVIYFVVFKPLTLKTNPVYEN